MSYSKKQIVIVGGVAGGMSAATRLRRLNPEAKIFVLEKSSYVSYANCGLPYFIGGVIAERQDLLLQTPESLHARFDLDVRIRNEVTAIDRERKVVTVLDLATGTEYQLSYDSLVLSPGAQPVVPPLPGIEKALTLRTVEDVTRIVDAVRAEPRHAVVVGGGFIGIETAENLRHRGIETTIIEALDQVLSPLDPEMAIPVAHEVRKHGVQLHLGVGVSAIHDEKVELSDGRLIPADLVILAIGVRPDITLAKMAGLDIGPRGGISTNFSNQTSDPDIYAIGDAAEKVDALDGEATLVPLANIANRQGRVVADHIMGRKVREVPSIGTAIVKVFDLTVATTGWNEKRLKRAGREYLVIHSHPGSHAGYYPGAKTLALKLLVDPSTHLILGAQGVGRDGVDKRIDVIATAMRAGLHAYELADLELAYAPPFGSAKDPINMLGYMAENIIFGLTETIQWDELDDHLAAGAVLLDVRTASEFKRGHIPRALNIPVDDLRERIDEIPREELVVYCQVGQRGHTGTLLLREFGFDAVNLDGGYQTWVHSPLTNVTR
ncbi:MAG TPA: FAD-dependent oxidoreductase [Candidatus Nanopelagicaceae bacterium]|nr:FAD-dependent oxidoreductase [Candidatus Nanopelagicaceae bacterium]